MRPHFLTLAALAAVLPAAPATAQVVAGAGFSSGAAFANTGSGITVHHGTDRGSDARRPNRDRDRDRGNGRFGDVYSDLRDGYDINRSWAADSFNDWWHDRPDRAFPRWMSTNQDCQRQWWSGGGWRC